LKILLTGFTGFLGKAIIQVLQNKHEFVFLGNREHGVLPYDLTKKIPSIPMVDMVIHAAGRAHKIPKSNEEIQYMYDVNTIGTQNLIDALHRNPPRTFVFISTVAVYGVDSGSYIDENTLLLGSTPYAHSKILAEKLVLKWGQDSCVNVVVLRLPVITGDNPPGNLGALINSIRKGYYLRIGSGEVRKSMVGSLDVANLLPSLIDKCGIYNLTDGIHPSIIEVDTHIANLIGRKVKRVPESFLRPIAKLGDYCPGLPLNTSRLKKLNSSLTFDDSKARRELNWSPEPALNSLNFTLNR